ncbi:MAG TPA: OmpA family protein [Polyangiaceae bacterium]|nr:OmpA family protein [Polyangiaceae bacterium]
MSWPALAEPPRLHGSAAATRALGGYQEREYGWGLAFMPSVELPITRAFGLQAEFAGIWLTQGDPPKNPYIEPQGEGSGLSGGVGPRLRPFAASHDGTRISPAGFWLGATLGAAYTNELLRPMFNAEIGYDFLDSPGKVGMGPMLGFYHVMQPNNQVRPEDANLVLVGVHALFDTGSGLRRDSDRDKDGIRDELDRCPDDAEDRDGFEDTDGCPEADNDRDGVLDLADHCPAQPEDRDGFEDDDGCPDVDNDKDGILDTKDRCPNEAEDKDEFEDEDGCPDTDNDKDGIPDVKDLCPFEPETINDYADSDGCPDEDQVRVVGDKIVLDDRVHFMINSHIIRKESFELLERLAKLIVDHPEYIHISIEGHADERGSEEFNEKLSRGRAYSVLEFLVKSGVHKNRLSHAGYGSKRPLVDSKGESAYYQNRRVEFIITREARVSGKSPLPPKPPSLGSDGPPPESEQPEMKPSSDSGATQPQSENPGRDSKPPGLALPKAPVLAPPSETTNNASGSAPTAKPTPKSDGTNTRGEP